MKNIPLNIIARRPSNEIEEMAFVLGGRKGSQPFLYTGGPTPMAFALSGPQEGRGIEIKRMRPEEVLVIPDVEIELDLSKAQMSAYVEEPIGAIVVGKAGNGITMLYEDRRRVTEVITVYFGRNQEERRSDNGDELLYRNWRIVKRLGDRTIELFDYFAEKEGDR